MFGDNAIIALLVGFILDIKAIIDTVHFYNSETLEYYQYQRNEWSVQGGKEYAIQEEAKEKRKKFKNFLIVANIFSVLWAIVCCIYMLQNKQIISISACIKSLIAFAEMFVFFGCMTII